MREPFPLRDAVRALVREAGLGPGDTVERLEGGLMHDVFRVDRDLVVRVGGDPDAVDFPKTANVLRAVAGHVAAPTLLHTDFSRARVPANVLVYRWVAGERLAALWPSLPTDEREHYLDQIERELRALHEISPDSVPEFRGLAPWPERKRRSVEASLARAAAEDAFHEDRLDRMRDVFERNAPSLATAPEPVLVHYDVHWENFVVRDGQIVALLDFDDVRLAPAEQDWWELLFALGADADPRVDLSWFAAHCGPELAGPGVLERFLLDEIDEIVKLLTDELGWIGREDAQREADAAYRRAFESDFFARLLSRATSAG